ncbi:methyltransferase, partial [Nephila pilipes]
YLHEEKLGTYWDKERYIVQEHYVNISLPFKDSCRFNIVQQTESSLADYIGYFSTWSSYQKFFKKDSENAEQLLHDIEMK